MTTDWHPRSTDAKIKALLKQGGSLQQVNDYINTFFDARLKKQIEHVCVTINCPDPWPPVLAQVWHASGMDVEEAALFMGGLYCRVANARTEAWISAPLPLFFNRADPRKWKPRHYIPWPGIPWKK
jgi:hypothetical protein